MRNRKHRCIEFCLIISVESTRFPTRSFSDLSCRMEQAALPTSRLSPVRYSASRAPPGAGPTVALLSLHCRLTVAWKARQCRVTVASSARNRRITPIFGPPLLAIDTMNFQLSRRCDPIPARPDPSQVRARSRNSVAGTLVVRIIAPSSGSGGSSVASWLSSRLAGI